MRRTARSADPEPLQHSSDRSGPLPLTLLLRRFTKGDAEAGSLVMRAIEADLRRIASRYMRKERKDHTLQTTALVNEVYLRLIGTDTSEWNDRNHFFAVASSLMRKVLVDYARARSARKRGGQKVTLDGDALSVGPIPVQILDIDRALTELARFAPRQARLVELHFFAGLSLEECAAALDVAPRTVDKDWQLARAWLRRKLQPKGKPA